MNALIKQQMKIIGYILERFWKNILKISQNKFIHSFLTIHLDQLNRDEFFKYNIDSISYEDIDFTDYITQDALTQAEEHCVSTKTCLMNHLQDLEFQNDSNISPDTSSNDKITHENNEDSELPKIKLSTFDVI